MRVLLLTSRDPGGRRTGRKVVLTTAVASLRALGHDVQVLAIARRLDPERPAVLDGVAVVGERPPGLARVLLNVATRFTRGALSLNECLYEAPRLRRRVRELVQREDIGVVVADTIRTAGLAQAGGVPVVADLDDLLSDRYVQMARGGASGAGVLGYYGESLPRPVAALAAAVVRPVLGLEVRVLRRREIAVARRAAAVSLVGAEEARTLAQRAGVPVDCLPMAVPIPPEPADVAAQPRSSAVFVGGLDYQPNHEAIAWFATAVLPAARAAVAGFELAVVGHCPPRIAAELAAHAGLVLRGYVDDLDAELRRHRAFVAPIRSGTGVKTKVVEAMAAGLPVVSTPLGVEGIGATDGEHCLVAEDAAAMAAGLRALADDAALAARIGGAARGLVRDGFAPDVLAARWERTLARATGGATRPTAGPRAPSAPGS